MCYLLNRFDKRDYSLIVVSIYRQDAIVSDAIDYSWKHGMRDSYMCDYCFNRGVVTTISHLNRNSKLKRRTEGRTENRASMCYIRYKLALPVRVTLISPTD